MLLYLSIENDMIRLLDRGADTTSTCEPAGNEQVYKQVRRTVVSGMMLWWVHGEDP